MFGRKKWYLIFVFLIGATQAYADKWDGIYNSSFEFKMGSSSVCPKILPIDIQLEIKNSEVVGVISNFGGGNKHRYCKLYHNGDITGNINADGTFKLKVRQSSGHSRSYSSYQIKGTLEKAKLYSKNKQYHPTHEFSLVKLDSEDAGSGGTAGTAGEQATADGDVVESESVDVPAVSVEESEAQKRLKAKREALAKKRAELEARKKKLKQSKEDLRALKGEDAVEQPSASSTGQANDSGEQAVVNNPETATDKVEDVPEVAQGEQEGESLQDSLKQLEKTLEGTAKDLIDQFNNSLGN